MKKFFTNLCLFGALLAFGAPAASAETTQAGVKMTYVNYEEPDKAYGVIPAGETAEAGYNKISGGSVGFVNTEWHVNFITYLQVDASAITGNITKVSLSFEASGSTDSKRNTGWGAGYNSSVWSADMTYNTADKTITTVGEQQWTTSKTATTFDNITLDITDALKDDEDRVATILIYETNAGGGYLKNPVVNVEWTNATTYDVTFTETQGADITVTINGSNVTKGTSLVNGTYSYTATAPGYKDYTGEFTVAGAPLNVEFTMTQKATWSYTVNGVDADGNVLGKITEGAGFENEDVTYYYPEFYLVGSKLYSKAKNGANPYFGANGNLDADNKVFTVNYNGTPVENVVFYKEAEVMEGFTSRDTNNAPIRCSNGLGGTVEGDVLLTTLPVGKYKIFGQVWGVEGLIAGVKIKAAEEGGENTEGEPETQAAEDTNLWTLASIGYLTDSTSEEFTLDKETELYVYTTGADSKRMLDLIYIQKTGDVDVSTGIENVLESNEATTMVFDMAGRIVNEKVSSLKAGIYIVRQGNRTTKIQVK